MNTLNIGDKMPTFECLDENENILKMILPIGIGTNMK